MPQETVAVPHTKGGTGRTHGKGAPPEYSSNEAQRTAAVPARSQWLRSTKSAFDEPCDGVVALQLDAVQKPPSNSNSTSSSGQDKSQLRFGSSMASIAVTQLGEPQEQPELDAVSASGDSPAHTPQPAHQIVRTQTQNRQMSSARVHPEDPAGPVKLDIDPVWRKYGSSSLGKSGFLSLARQLHKPILRTSGRAGARGTKIQRVRFDESESRQYHKSRFHVQWLIQPGSRFELLWGMSMLLPLSYEIWAFAFRLALGAPISRRNTWNVVDVTDLLIDVLFLIDGSIQLNTMPAKSTGVSGRTATVMTQGETVSLRSQIAWRYFSRVFPFELLPSVLFWLASAWKSCPITVWWLCMLVRALPRSKRLTVYFREIAMDLSIEIFYLQTFKFMLYLFMSMHYFGCLFYWLADNYPPIVSARDSAHAQETQGSTWISNLEKRFPPFVVAQSTLSEKYLICECSLLEPAGFHSCRHRSPV